MKVFFIICGCIIGICAAIGLVGLIVFGVIFLSVACYRCLKKYINGEDIELW